MKIFALTILFYFIIKLRFPKDKPTTTVIYVAKDYGGANPVKEIYSYENLVTYVCTNTGIRILVKMTISRLVFYTFFGICIYIGNSMAHFYIYIEYIKK